MNILQTQWFKLPWTSAPSPEENILDHHNFISKLAADSVAYTLNHPDVIAAKRQHEAAGAAETLAKVAWESHPTSNILELAYLRAARLTQHRSATYSEAVGQATKEFLASRNDT